jgi:hypothetical protein
LIRIEPNRNVTADLPERRESRADDGAQSLADPEYKSPWDSRSALEWDLSGPGGVFHDHDAQGRARALSEDEVEQNFLVGF